ncbi:MAG: hypothetical protein HZB38_13185 [Planctomycetes bacterium]|nr:hypothetical protein [Planctomycetota bacterium]
MKPTSANGSSRLVTTTRSATAAAWVLALIFELMGGPNSNASDQDRAEVAPDPTLQSAIIQVAKSPGPEKQAAIEKAVASGKASPEEFVRQLVYYASRTRDPNESLVAGVILKRADIPEATIARALAPCLESKDAPLVKSVRNMLGGLEKRAAGRRPDFSSYRELLEEPLRDGRPTPSGLVRYLYQEDPGMALLTLMRAHQLRKPEEIKPILWAEHVVSDVLWKQQYGFLKPGEIEPPAAAELSALAHHQAWWARFYAAEIMRQHAEFRQTESLAELARDENELVRESAEQRSR